MRREFVLQDPGEGIHEVDILEIHVSEGDEIAEGQEVMAVESDKAAIDLPSPYAGTVRDIRVASRDTAQVGDVLMVIEDGAKEEGASADGGETGGARKSASDGSGDGAEASKDKEHTRADGDDKAHKGDDARQQSPRRDGKPDRDAPVRASPAARRKAAEAGLKLEDIEPTGAEGQITVHDVASASEDEQDVDGSAEETSRSAGDTGTRRDMSGRRADGDAFGPVTRSKASALRLATARAMQRSWSEIPHVWHEDAADLTRIERWRRRRAAEGHHVSMTAILVRAVVTVLRDHPVFNASYDAEDGAILLRRYFNINVAVATDRGLVTPVLTDADGKSVSELSADLADLADRARAGKLGKADMTGGTFTVTNVGAIGGRGLSPLINPPQTAILGAARGRNVLVPRDEGPPGPVDPAKLETRLEVPLVLGFDHRVIDGAEAAEFMNDLVARLSDPVTLAMEN